MQAEKIAKDIDLEDFVPPKEAARLLDKAVATLARWRCEKKNLNFYKSSGSILYSKTELLNFIKKGHVVVGGEK